METKAALRCLAALAQETRLELFRLLVGAEPGGLAAGLIAERLGVAPATLSFHLHQMETAGLLTSRREGRQIFYALDHGAVRSFLGFLLADCCQGRPEICAPLGLACAPAVQDPATADGL